MNDFMQSTLNIPYTYYLVIIVIEERPIITTININEMAVHTNTTTFRVLLKEFLQRNTLRPFEILLLLDLQERPYELILTVQCHVPVRFKTIGYGTVERFPGDGFISTPRSYIRTGQAIIFWIRNKPHLWPLPPPLLCFSR